MKIQTESQPHALAASRERVLAGARTGGRSSGSEPTGASFVNATRDGHTFLWFSLWPSILLWYLIHQISPNRVLHITCFIGCARVSWVCNHKLIYETNTCGWKARWVALSMVSRNVVELIFSWGCGPCISICSWLNPRSSGSRPSLVAMMLHLVSTSSSLLPSGNLFCPRN